MKANKRGQTSIVRSNEVPGGFFLFLCQKAFCIFHEAFCVFHESGCEEVRL